MAKVEKVTLKGVIKGLGNEELILMNTDQSEIVRTKTKNDRFKITAEVETGDLRYYMLYRPPSVRAIRAFDEYSRDLFFHRFSRNNYRGRTQKRTNKYQIVERFSGKTRV